MHIKIVELRDKMTFIPCFVIKLEDHRNNEHEEYLIHRIGFGQGNLSILFGRLEGGKVNHNPHDWNDRTFQTAHNWLLANFDSFKSGDVVDVEFILGETKESKLSELTTAFDSVVERAHVDE